MARDIILEKCCSPFIFANSAVSTLQTSISPIDTVFLIDVNDVDKFPKFIEGSEYYLSLSYKEKYEIVKVTNFQDNRFTVIRGQYQTNPNYFPVGTRVELKILGEFLERIQKIGIYSVSYLHIQNVPSNKWRIVHKLNFYPNVYVYNNNLRLVQPKKITYVSSNEIKIEFENSESGYAFLVCDPLKVYNYVTEIQDKIQALNSAVQSIESLLEKIENLLSSS